jgi:DNA-binding CsgD family transcriptional regulator
VRGIERVLDVLLDPLRFAAVDDWRYAVLRELGPLLGADQMSFQLPYPGHELFLSDIDHGLVRTYIRHFIPQLDRTKNYTRRMIQLGVGNRRTLWRSDRKWLYRSEYYNECIVPMRAFGPLWMSARTPGSELPSVILAHVDQRYGRRMGPREQRILRVLRPALSSAVRVVRRLRTHREAITSTVDALDTGTLMFSADGRLLHENPAASRLLARTDAGAVRARAARVARSAMSAGNWIGTGERRPGAEAEASIDGVRLRPARISSSRAPAEPAILVVLEPENSAEITAERIQTGARLTARQAEVGLLLTRRCTNAEIARALGISPATARHHTEAVMTAIQVRRRQDVAARLEELCR